MNRSRLQANLEWLSLQPLPNETQEEYNIMNLANSRCVQAIIVAFAAVVSSYAQPIANEHPVAGVLMAILMALGAVAIYVVLDVCSRPGVLAKVHAALKDEGAPPAR
jgi:hypothetical protein